VHAYLEAHIEQGPVLESGGYTLGIVTGIQGVRWFEVTVRGRSAHAGTTPCEDRQDALMTAASLVAEVGDLAQGRRDSALRVTVGRFEVAPGSINTVANQVIFTIDLRHPDEAVLEELEQAFRTLVASGAGTCSCELRRLMQRAPTAFDPQVLAVLEAAVRETGVPFRRIGSGAFHDAMYLADVCPTAMLFVPSREGISHNPAEDTAESDLVAGTRALAGALATLAND
jgi:N-carbamoyl-L-amino-acid hydrolase